MTRTAAVHEVTDRRRGERVERVLAVQHRLLRRAGRKHLAAWSLSNSRNMSHSGMLFLSTVPYREKDVLELQVVMSGVIDIFSGHAEVVRVVERGSTTFDVAVKYLPVKPAARKAKSHLRS